MNIHAAMSSRAYGGVYATSVDLWDCPSDTTRHNFIGGGYQLSGLTMVDLFPQTFHLEAVAQLKLA